MRHHDETAIEYLRRIVSNVSYEPESLLDDLPTVEAIVEYFELWAKYDTDFLDGILEGIAEGEDQKPLQDFIDKYKLPWVIPAGLLPGEEVRP